MYTYFIIPSQSTYLAEVSGGDAPPSAGSMSPYTRSLPREFRWSSPKSSAAARQFYDVTKDQLFVSKCIVLVGRQQYVGAAKNFLVRLYRSVALFTI